jgi:hypothetical protein
MAKEPIAISYRTSTLVVGLIERSKLMVWIRKDSRKPAGLVIVDLPELVTGLLKKIADGNCRDSFH